MKLVQIQRTGTAVFVWDSSLDTGHHFETGDTRLVSADCATQLSSDSGWEIPAEHITDLEG